MRPVYGPQPDKTPAQPIGVLEPDLDKRTRLSPMYRVLVHNDPITTADFVVRVLSEVFEKDLHAAIAIMQEAHNTGVALVEVVPLERAEFLVDQAHSLARAAKYPLTFTYEPDE